MGKKMGRPTKFDEKIVQKVEVLTKEGKTNEQIADLLGISRTTLFTWCGKYGDLMNALKAGKDISDDLVEIALFQRALGYTRTVKKTHITKYGEAVEYDEHMVLPPDPTSAIFWLKNRRPEKWREKNDTIPNEGINLVVRVVEEKDVDQSNQPSDPQPDTTASENKKLPEKI